MANGVIRLPGLSSNISPRTNGPAHISLKQFRREVTIHASEMVVDHLVGMACLDKAGIVASVIDNSDGRTHFAFNGLTLPNSGRNVQNFSAIALNCAIEQSGEKLYPAVHMLNRWGVVELTQAGATLIPYRPEIETAMQRFWDDKGPHLGTSSTPKPILQRQIYDIFDISAEGFTGNELEALLDVLPEIDPKDLKQTSSFYRSHSYRLAAYSYRLYDNALEFTNTGMLIANLSAFKLLRSLLISGINHELGHARHFRLPRAQYREFIRINNYQHRLLGYAKKVVFGIGLAPLFLYANRESFSTNGIYFTLRAFSRFLDAHTLTTKKDIKSYVSFYSVVSMMEDFAEQYALFKAHPNLFEHFAGQDEILRRNLAYFRTLG